MTPQQTDQPDSVQQRNKDIVLDYLDRAWGHGDWSVAEQAVDPDVVFHDQVRDGDLPPGREGLRVVMDRIRTGIPDFVMHIEHVIAEDDFVVVLWHATGTHAGEFNGFPPTGLTATLHAISIVRLQDGRIVEGWQEADQLGMAQQIGMIPQGGMPAPMARAMAFRARRAGRRQARA